MRWLLVLSNLAAFSTGLQIPQLQPFLTALPPSLLEYLPLSITNETVHELLRRQNTGVGLSNTCPTGFNSCDNIGGTGLCCAPEAACAPDQAGHVACCPSGAVCTGAITGVITAGTVDPNGALVGAGGVGGAGAATTTGPNSLLGASQATTTTAFQTAATTNNGLVVASQATTASVQTTGAVQTTDSGGFIIDGSSTVATPGAAVRGAQIVSMISSQVCDGSAVDYVTALFSESDHSSTRVPAHLGSSSLKMIGCT